MQPNVSVLVDPDLPETSKVARRFYESESFVMRKMKFAVRGGGKNWRSAQRSVNEFVPENYISRFLLILKKKTTTVQKEKCNSPRFEKRRRMLKITAGRMSSLNY